MATTQEFPGVFVTDTVTAAILQNKVNNKIYKQHLMFMIKNFTKDDTNIKLCTLVLGGKPILPLKPTAIREISDQLREKSFKSETQITGGRAQRVTGFSTPSVGVIFLDHEASRLGNTKIFESIICLHETLDIVKSQLDRAQCKYKLQSYTTTVDERSLDVTKITPNPSQLNTVEKNLFVHDIMNLANLASFELDAPLKINLSKLRLPTQND